MTWELFNHYLPLLLRGTGLTLQLTGAAFAVGLVVGLLGVLGRLSRSRVLRGVTTAYIEIVRGTPAVVQLFIVYYGLAEYGIRLPAFAAAVLALGLFGGAFFAEIFRAGVQSIDQGQLEAAQALGLRSRSIWLKVLLPQTILLVLPPIANMVIDLLKATALVVTIGARDLMYEAFNAASDTYRAMEFYLAAGVIYLAIAYPLSRVVERLEQVGRRYSS